MNNRDIFERVCAEASRFTTRSFSTSFSLGIASLHRRFHAPIYGIYGFVRFADEIVDTFHAHPQQRLLDRFKADTEQAIADRISLNPILHSFQKVVHAYGIGPELIADFLHSMQMDLERQTHDERSIKTYILGSAESVGLMCLKVFCENDCDLYESLKQPAMKLGSAFQKVNFLRDLRQDGAELNRAYFPGTSVAALDPRRKREIEMEIEGEFQEAAQGIARLPRSSRMGVRLAYRYYLALFRKIQHTPAERILQDRIRVADSHKLRLLVSSYLQHRLHLA